MLTTRMKRSLPIFLLFLLLAHVGACTSAPVPAEAPPCVPPEKGLPTELRCTGLYANRSLEVIADDVLPYQPGVLLWSDGAEKRRFLQLPPGSQIDTSHLDAWKFPVDTKVWKEFAVDGKVIETRLLWKRPTGKWDVGTYIWDLQAGTATLNTATKGVILASGYEIPTVKDCDKCHHGGSDTVLGVEAVALGLPNATGATLSVLATKGLLTHPPAQTTVKLPEDATGKAGEALGYLHANCGMPCHSTRGLGEETQLVLRLRADELWPNGPDGGAPAIDAQTTDIWKASLNQPPKTASVAQKFPGAFRITPGVHEQSLVWLVSHLRGNYQMPPLVSHRIDEAGTQKLADWIDALPK